MAFSALRRRHRYDVESMGFVPWDENVKQAELADTFVHLSCKESNRSGCWLAAMKVSVKSLVIGLKSASKPS